MNSPAPLNPVVLLSLLLSVLGSLSGQAAPSANPGTPAPLALDYVEGIEALSAADLPRAVAALTRAIATDDENPDYHRARGVAHTLSENFPAALADLQRAVTAGPPPNSTR